MVTTQGWAVLLDMVGREDALGPEPVSKRRRSPLDLPLGSRPAVGALPAPLEEGRQVVPEEHL